MKASSRLSWAAGFILITACSTGGKGSGGGSSTTASTSSGGSQASSGTLSTTGAGPSATGATGGSQASTGAGTGGAGACLGSNLLGALGKTHLLDGVSTTDAVAASAPFDVRYQYISGGIADGAGPCNSCATGCTSKGTSCANSVGCGWWGCWQYDQDPPGAYVRNFVTTASTHNEIPMFSYYMVLQASGVTEGQPEVDIMNDATFLGRYLADYRFLLQQIGTSVAIAHIEPDFWGYAEQHSENPHTTPAAVPTANATDCATEEASIAGLGRCMIAMSRKYAPNVKVSLHGSAWATNMDVLGNTSPTFDVAGEATKLASFMKECAPDADLLVIDAADRDAQYYQSLGKNTWWDNTNATLPDFHQAFAWSKAVSEAYGKPNLWWQIPVGNMSLAGGTNHWKDNRLDYFFAHWDEVAAAHGLGAAFGAGAGDQTTPETDGGNLVAKTQAYASAGGQKLCP
jgi:hypothetical protein